MKSRLWLGICVIDAMALLAQETGTGTEQPETFDIVGRYNSGGRNIL